MVVRKAVLPIGDWAKAVWEGRLPRLTIAGMIARAKLKLVTNTNVWSATGGPATAVIATCERIGWTVIDSQHFRTDDGVVLDLVFDPLAVVVRHVRDVVVRWRWRRIEANFPSLAANGSGEVL